MTTGDSHWTFHRGRLGEALNRWRSKNPSAESQRLVDEFLMDLVGDPFACGEQDGTSGVWTGLPGNRIVVVYVPNPPAREIVVADINFR